MTDLPGRGRRKGGDREQQAGVRVGGADAGRGPGCTVLCCPGRVYELVRHRPVFRHAAHVQAVTVPGCPGTAAKTPPHVSHCIPPLASAGAGSGAMPGFGHAAGSQLKRRHSGHCSLEMTRPVCRRGRRSPRLMGSRVLGRTICCLRMRSSASVPLLAGRAMIVVVKGSSVGPLTDSPGALTLRGCRSVAGRTVGQGPPSAVYRRKRDRGGRSDCLRLAGRTASEVEAVLLTGSAPHAVLLAGLQRPQQALLTDRAALSTDRLGLISLQQRLDAGADREEQVRVLLTAGRAVTPPITAPPPGLRAPGSRSSSKRCPPRTARR